MPRFIGYKDSYVKIVAAALLAIVAMTVSVVVHAETRPPIVRKEFKLDSETGCFSYTGNAVEFVGRIKRGSYVGVQMLTLDETGLPVLNEERIPLVSAPEFRTGGRMHWFGPLPTGGIQTITYMPTMLFGSRAEVLICGSLEPPERTLGLTPAVIERLSEAAPRLMATDPYSLALLDEPKALIQDEPEPEPEASRTIAVAQKANACEPPLRNVIVRAMSKPDETTLRPTLAGNIRIYDDILQAPYSVYALCFPSDPSLPTYKVILPDNTGDCFYFAGKWGRFVCTYLAEGEEGPPQE